MKRFIKKYLLFALLTINLLAFAACSGSNTYYLIGFKTNGGSAIENLELKKGSTIELPEDPVKEGNTFLGWYYDSKLTKKYDDLKKMPDRSFYLFAKWGVTLTFDSQGGSSVNSIIGTEKQALKTETPTYADNIFLGWYLDKECTKKLGLVMPNKNTTVYAKWQAIEKTTALDLTNDLTLAAEGRYVVLDTDDNFKKVVATTNKDVWDYFYFPLNFDVSTYSTLEMVVEGKKDTKFMTKLEGGNATNIEVARVLTGEEQKIYWTVDSTNLTKTGGQKLIFFLNHGTAGADSENPEYIIIKSIKLFKTKNLDDTADQVIFFNTLGGNNIAPIFKELNSELQMPADPVKPGYKFMGWYLDETTSEQFTSTTMPQGPTTLFAKWEESQSVTITFNTLGGNEIAPISVPKGSLTPEFITPTNNDLLFIGWFKDKNCLIKFTDKTIEDSITLYALFVDPSTDFNSYSKSSILEGWEDNEQGSTNISYLEDGSLNIKTTAQKGEWSYIKTEINELTLEQNILKLIVKGTKDRTMKLKFRGVDLIDREYDVTFTGEEQTIYFIMPVLVTNTYNALIFVDGGKKGSDVSNTEINIKELAFYSVGTSIDFSNYQELEYELQLGYWNSGMDALIHTNLKSYACTKQFTKEELPNGTILVLEKGFTLTPDGFINPEVKDSKGRPKKLSAKEEPIIITIDDNWWLRSATSLDVDDLTMKTRCFNIGTVTNLNLTTNLDYAKLGFKIYIPKL